MLVLSRKVGQKIIIADNIEVVVVEIDRGRIRLGIVAPADVTINRNEVAEAIKQHGQLRSNSDD